MTETQHTQPTSTFRLNGELRVEFTSPTKDEMKAIMKFAESSESLTRAQGPIIALVYEKDPGKGDEMRKLNEFTEQFNRNRKDIEDALNAKPETETLEMTDEGEPVQQQQEQAKTAETDKDESKDESDKPETDKAKDNGESGDK